MKKQKLKLILLLLSILMVFCTMFFGVRVLSYANTMSVKYQESGLSSKQIDAQNAKAFLSDEDVSSLPYLTGWDQIEDTHLESPSLGRTQTVTLLEVYGTMEAVLPFPLLYGSYLQKTDTRGCIISQASAEALFQSKNVLGCPITIEETQYIVKGVLNSKEALLLIQKDRSTPFPFLEFEYENKREAASNTKALFFQLGLPEYDSFLEGNFYAGIAYLLMGFPCFLLACLLIFRVKKIVPKNSIFLWNNVKTILISALLIILFFFFAKHFIVFSDDYIPTKLSDFSFWIMKYKELTSDYEGLLTYQSYQKEHWILRNLSYTFTASLTSTILLFIAKWYH